MALGAGVNQLCGATFHLVQHYDDIVQHVDTGTAQRVSYDIVEGEGGITSVAIECAAVGRRFSREPTEMKLFLIKNNNEFLSDP